MLLLEYRNPKEKYHERIKNADLGREEIVVAIIPRSLYCEICNSPRKFVWELPELQDENGRYIRICPICLATYRKLQRLSVEEAQQILNA